MASVPSAFSAADEPSIWTLTVREYRDGTAVVLEVRGEIDLATAGQLAAAAEAALAARPARLILDLAAVDFFSAAGYHLLADVLEGAEQVGCVLSLRGLSPAVRRFFELLPPPGGLFD